MSVSWYSPVPISGNVAMGMHALLCSLQLFELTSENLALVQERNNKDPLIFDSESKQPADLRGLVGFWWSW